MKSLLVTGVFLASAAGFAVSGGGDDCATKAAKAGDCSATAQKGECPASDLIARWEKASEQMAALPAATLEKISTARATLSASCPVCKEGPEAFALVGKFFATNAAFDQAVLAACGEECEEGAESEIPAEVKAAFEERMAIGSRASQLYGVFASALAPPKGEECAEGSEKSECCQGEKAEDCCMAEKLDIAAAAEKFDGVSKKATELASRWNGIPARAASLPAETKTELFAAMAVMEKEMPACDLAKETLAMLAGGLDRCVALDAKLAEHCEASSKECPVTGELPAEVAAMKKAAKARTEASKQVASLLRTMVKTMTPEIFEAAPAVEVAGGGGN